MFESKINRDQFPGIIKFFFVNSHPNLVEGEKPRQKKDDQIEEQLREEYFKVSLLEFQTYGRHKNTG